MASGPAGTAPRSASTARDPVVDPGEIEAHGCLPSPPPAPADSPTRQPSSADGRGRRSPASPPRRRVPLEMLSLPARCLQAALRDRLPLPHSTGAADDEWELEPGPELEAARCRVAVKRYLAEVLAALPSHQLTLAVSWERLPQTLRWHLQGVETSSPAEKGSGGSGRAALERLRALCEEEPDVFAVWLQLPSTWVVRLACDDLARLGEVAAEAAAAAAAEAAAAAAAKEAAATAAKTDPAAEGRLGAVSTADEASCSTGAGEERPRPPTGLARLICRALPDLPWERPDGRMNRAIATWLASSPDPGRGPHTASLAGVELYLAEEQACLWSHPQYAWPRLGNFLRAPGSSGVFVVEGAGGSEEIRLDLEALHRAAGSCGGLAARSATASTTAEPSAQASSAEVAGAPACGCHVDDGFEWAAGEPARPAAGPETPSRAAIHTLIAAAFPGGGLSVQGLPEAVTRRVIAARLASSPQPKCGERTALLPRLVKYLRLHHKGTWLNPAYKWPELNAFMLAPESQGVFAVERTPGGQQRVRLDVAALQKAAAAVEAVAAAARAGAGGAGHAPATPLPQEQLLSALLHRFPALGPNEPNHLAHAAKRATAQLLAEAPGHKLPLAGLGVLVPKLMGGAKPPRKLRVLCREDPDVFYVWKQTHPARTCMVRLSWSAVLGPGQLVTEPDGGGGAGGTPLSAGPLESVRREMASGPAGRASAAEPPGPPSVAHEQPAVVAADLASLIPLAFPGDGLSAKGLPEAAVRRAIAAWLASSPCPGLAPHASRLTQLGAHLRKEPTGLWLNPAYKWPKLKPFLLAPESQGVFAVTEGPGPGLEWVRLDLPELRRAAAAAAGAEATDVAAGRRLAGGAARAGVGGGAGPAVPPPQEQLMSAVISRFPPLGPKDPDHLTHAAKRATAQLLVEALGHELPLASVRSEVAQLLGSFMPSCKLRALCEEEPDVFAVWEQAPNNCMVQLVWAAGPRPVSRSSEHAGAAARAPPASGPAGRASAAKTAGHPVTKGRPAAAAAELTALIPRAFPGDGLSAQGLPEDAMRRVGAAAAAVAGTVGTEAAERQRLAAGTAVAAARERAGSAATLTPLPREQLLLALLDRSPALGIDAPCRLAHAAKRATAQLLAAAPGFALPLTSLGSDVAHLLGTFMPSCKLRALCEQERDVFAVWEQPPGACWMVRLVCAGLAATGEATVTAATPAPAARAVAAGPPVCLGQPAVGPAELAGPAEAEAAEPAGSAHGRASKAGHLEEDAAEPAGSSVSTVDAAGPPMAMCQPALALSAAPSQSETGPAAEEPEAFGNRAAVGASASTDADKEAAEAAEAAEALSATASDADKEGSGLSPGPELSGLSLRALPAAEELESRGAAKALSASLPSPTAAGDASAAAASSPVRVPGSIEGGADLEDAPSLPAAMHALITAAFPGDGLSARGLPEAAVRRAIAARLASSPQPLYGEHTALLCQLGSYLPRDHKGTCPNSASKWPKLSAFLLAPESQGVFVIEGTPVGQEWVRLDVAALRRAAAAAAGAGGAAAATSAAAAGAEARAAVAVTEAAEPQADRRGGGGGGDSASLAGAPIGPEALTLDEVPAPPVPKGQPAAAAAELAALIPRAFPGDGLSAQGLPEAAARRAIAAWLATDSFPAFAPYACKLSRIGLQLCDEHADLWRNPAYKWPSLKKFLRNSTSRDVLRMVEGPGPGHEWVYLDVVALRRAAAAADAITGSQPAAKVETAARAEAGAEAASMGTSPPTAAVGLGTVGLLTSCSAALAGAKQAPPAPSPAVEAAGPPAGAVRGEGPGSRPGDSRAQGPIEAAVEHRSAALGAAAAGSTGPQHGAAAEEGRSSHPETAGPAALVQPQPRLRPVPVAMPLALAPVSVPPTEAHPVRVAEPHATTLVPPPGTAQTVPVPVPVPVRVSVPAPVTEPAHDAAAQLLLPQPLVLVVSDPFTPALAAMLQHCRACTHLGLAVHSYGGAPAVVCLYAPPVAGEEAGPASVGGAVYVIDLAAAEGLHGGGRAGAEAARMLLFSLRGLMEDPALGKVVHGREQVHALEAACGRAAAAPLLDTRLMLTGLTAMLGVSPPRTQSAWAFAASSSSAAAGAPSLSLAAVTAHVSALRSGLAAAGLWQDRPDLMAALSAVHFAALRDELGPGEGGGAAWGSRPLSPSQVAVAAASARHLPELWTALWEASYLASVGEVGMRGRG